MSDKWTSLSDKNNENIADQNFKSIVHKASILSWILRSCIDELKDKSIDEIKQGLDIGADGFSVKGRETEQFSEENGPIKMDNIFDVNIVGTNESIAVIVNLEAQNNSSPGYPIGKRAEYYISRLVSNQKGEYFKGNDYGGIRKVYSIWMMMDPFRGNRKSIIKYRMRPETIGDPKQVEMLETFNIVFINLGGEYSDEMPDELKFSATLFSNDLSENERKKILLDKYNIPKKEYPNKELIGLGTLYEDTKNRYLREGRIEGKAESALMLVQKNGVTVEDAAEIVASSLQEKEQIIGYINDRESSGS